MRSAVVVKAWLKVLVVKAWLKVSGPACTHCERPSTVAPVVVAAMAETLHTVTQREGGGLANPPFERSGSAADVGGGTHAPSGPCAAKPASACRALSMMSEAYRRVAAGHGSVSWRRSSWACGYAFREFGADQWKMTDRNFRRSPAAPVCGRNVYSSPEQSAFLKTIATLAVRFLGE